MNSKRFLRFAAICCFLSVITTLGIHLYFPDGPPEFEKRVLLYKDTIYLLNRWWVIVHCLLVIISMWGFALIQFRKSPGFAGLGFLFLAVFGIAEITRQLLVLFYVNGLREQYVSATDPMIRDGLRTSITHFSGIGLTLFGLFALAFALGNLFNGISLSGEKRLGKWLGILLIVWAFLSFIGLGNEFWKKEAISNFFPSFNYTFQPLIRFLLGLWIWKKAEAGIRTQGLGIRN